jgi:hypothetical protein
LRGLLVQLGLDLDVGNSLCRTWQDGLILNHLLHVVQLQSDSDVDELALFSGSFEKDFLLSDGEQYFLSVGGELGQNLGRLIGQKGLHVGNHLVHLRPEISCVALGSHVQGRVVFCHFGSIYVR